MRETLMIFMRVQDLDHPDWVVTDTNGQAMQPATGGDPAALAALAQHRDVMVIVPAADVLLTTVKMPRMSRGRLLQALPFALEDQLVSEVDTLHFVAGDPDAQERLPVAVVAKSKMDSWVALLKSWQITPDIMMPVTLVLPITENTWHMLIMDEWDASRRTVVVRTSAYHGFYCDSAVDGLAIALHSAETKPESLCVWQSGNHALPPCDIPLTCQTFTPEKLLMELAHQVTQTPRINLLQGGYQNKKVKYPQKRKMLQLAMGLTAVWIILLLLNPVISWILLNQRVGALNGQIRHIYLRHFPHAASLVAPRLRMEEKLKKSAAGENENKLFLLLYAVSNAMKSQPGVSLKRLDYQNNQLAMEVTATSSENFAGFTDVLIQQGWQVKQQNANLAGDNVNATIVMQ